jgi:hypothetical protein
MNGFRKMESLNKSRFLLLLVLLGELQKLKILSQQKKQRSFFGSHVREKTILGFRIVNPRRSHQKMTDVVVLCIDIMEFRNTATEPIVIEEDLEPALAPAPAPTGQEQREELVLAQPATQDLPALEFDAEEEINIEDWLDIL